MAHAFDEAAVHQVFRLAGIHDLPADVHRAPRALHRHGLVAVHRQFDDVGDVSGVGELERRAEAGALGQASRRLVHPDMSRTASSTPRARAGLNPPAAPVALRAVQQIDPVLNRILPGRHRHLVDEALDDERDAVGGRRAHRARRAR